MGTPADRTRELAHELQAPLTALELRLNALRDELPESHAVASCLEEIAHLKRLVTSFLELEPPEIHSESLELAPVLDAVKSRLAPLADARGVEIRVACGSIRALADARATERILTNLVDNAIKFSVERGRVDVSARVENGFVELRVRDRGIGIPVELRARIFEPFYRVDRDVAGTGLGLAISKRLAETQRGSLRCESELGHGSAFILTLPRDVILVVCPNLAVDVTVELDVLRVGEVHRAKQCTRRAGGKGVNLARAATALGERVLVLGFVSGARGLEIRNRLADEAFAAELVPADGESRTCTIALEPSGRATVINESGPVIEDVSALVDAFHQRLPEARAVAFAGSVQPGVSPALYRELIAATVDRGVFCLVDTAGAALAEALSARPSVAKPNRAEAEAWLATTLDSDGACGRAVHALRDAGAAIALVTRGAAGVVAGTSEGVFRCRSAEPVDIRYGNPIGAGDALAAGIVVGHLRGFSPTEAVRLGVASACASLAQGYGRFRARDVRPEAVTVEPLD